MVGTTAIPTQADIKTRWPDGSVAHAILSFYLNIGASQSRTVCFRDQPTGLNDQFLTPSQMLASNYNFDARTILMNPVNNQMVTASARTGLSAQKFTYWLQGRNATSIIIADHSVARTLDLGFDAYRSFRPTWEATFYPLSNLVRVRVSGEISNTEALQDMTYNLAIALGAAAPQIVLDRPSLKHHAMGTWSREFWLGNQAPPELAIDHNLTYLSQTGFVPNYDTSVIVPQSVLDAEYNSWLSTSREFTQPGNWTIYMGETGGRAEIGPVPSWISYWLYSGDLNMAKYSMRQAELAGNWPMNFREGDPTKFFNPERTIPGLGLPMSPIDRQSLLLYDKNIGITSAPASGNDALNIVAPISNDGWLADGAHQPDPFSTVYALTGEYWFFERLFNWSMWGRFHKSGSNVSNGRGPNGWSLRDQWRADAWMFRTRVLAAFLCPDSHVVKSELNRAVHEGIAIWEGMRNITSTAFYNTPSWVWGNTTARTGAGSANSNDRGIYGMNGVAHTSPPRYVQAEALHLWSNGELPKPNNVNPDIDTVGLPWQANYLIHVLARAEEMGYPTLALKSWIGQYTTKQLLDPSYSPILSGQYYMPQSTTTTSPASFFQTLSAAQSGYAPTILANAETYFFAGLSNLSHGFPIIMRTAVQSLSNVPTGPQAQNMVDALVSVQPIDFSNDPKWAIKRR